jgi:hypothetical protein
MFAKAVGEGSAETSDSDDAIMIKATAAMAVVKRAVGAGRSATAGIRTVLAKKSFIALMLMAWFPFIVRAVQIYAAAPAAGGVSQMTAETCRQFLDRQQIFVFFVTVYIGSGYRQRPPRQCAADLPVEAAHQRRIHLRQARRVDDVPVARHLGAGNRAADRANRLRRQLHVLPRQHLPVSGDHRVFLHHGDDGRGADAGAVVALEQ